METVSQFATKTELYSVAVRICQMIVFTGVASILGSDWMRACAVFAAAYFMVHYSSKLRTAKRNPASSDWDPE